MIGSYESWVLLVRSWRTARLWGFPKMQKMTLRNEIHERFLQTLFKFSGYQGATIIDVAPYLQYQYISDTHTQISWSCCFNKIWVVWKFVKSQTKSSKSLFFSIFLPCPSTSRSHNNQWVSPGRLCHGRPDGGDSSHQGPRRSKREWRLMSGFRKILVVDLKFHHDRITFFIFQSKLRVLEVLDLLNFQVHKFQTKLLKCFCSMFFTLFFLLTLPKSTLYFLVFFFPFFFIFPRFSVGCRSTGVSCFWSADKKTRFRFDSPPPWLWPSVSEVGLESATGRPSRFGYVYQVYTIAKLTSCDTKPSKNWIKRPYKGTMIIYWFIVI